MRAKDFITEYDAFEKGNFIQKQILGKYVLKARVKEKTNGSTVLLVTVYDPKNPKQGMMSREFEQFGFDGIASFRFLKKSDGSVVSADTAVDKEYQRQGIASEVYKFVKKLGYDVKPSSMLTPQGKEMWRGFQNKGVLNEVPLPPDWDPNQMALRKPFKDRMKYVRGMSPKLGHGSSREVRIVNYEGRPTALKVAKNLRGLAQNEEEIKILDDGYLGRLPIVIPLIDYDKENRRPVWVQTEVASKVNAQTLKDLLRTPNMWMLTDTVEVLLGKSKKYRPNTTVDSLKEFYFNPKTWDGRQPTEDMYEIFMDYVTDIATIVDSSNIELADLQDPGNWGQFHGKPVILDLGLTSDVWQKYYKNPYGKNV